ncbi:MAG TPA: FtsX-like permease family protein [Solirubrobacteraceae bacterium]|jgi:putative ABC transport system permease protein
MRVSTIFYLYRVRLRARLVQELLAVAGIAVGVALLFASQVANTSLSGSVTRLTDGLVGSARLQIAARDPQGFDEGLLSQVQALAGVRTAVPVLQRSAYVMGPSGEESVDLIGLDAGFVRLQGRLLSHVSATQLPKQEGLALPAPVARKIGAGSFEALSVDIGDMRARTQVAVILQRSDIGELVDSGVVIAPLGLAQDFAGMQGRVSRILIEPQPGRDREVERGLDRIAAGQLNVLPANSEAAVFRQAEAPTAQSTEMFSAISALVGFLFAFNAMLLTVPQRRNLIADLRLDGYTPGEILEVMLFDVLALGVVGIACGLALGELLSRSLLQAEPGYLSLAFPVESLHIVSWQNVAVAAAGGILAAVIGVMVPLRHEIFRNDQVGPHRPKHGKRTSFTAALVGGVVCLLLTTVILIDGITTVGAAILAFASLMLALLLIMPAAFGGLLALVNGMQRGLMGVSSRIALIELMSGTTRSRSLAIAATGAIAVFGCVSIEGARSDLKTGLSRSAADVSLGTDLWVSPAGSATTLATTPFKNAYGRMLGRLADVGTVGDYRGGFLDIGDRRVLVIAPPVTNPRAMPTSQVVSADPSLASSRLSSGGWIAISRTLANERKARVGSFFSLASPVPMRFRIAAIVTNLGWAPGAIVMNPNDYARAWGSGEVSAYLVTLKQGVPLLSGLREVQSALRTKSDLVVQTAEQHKQNDISAQKQGLARLTQIAALVLVAAALAMAAAMGAMIWQRRPRLAGMKVDGFSQGELWRALLWEAGLLLGAGCTIGAAFGLYGQLVLSHALVSVTGFPVVFSVAIPVAIASLAIIASIALAMVALPGYFAAQVKPALQD